MRGPGLGEWEKGCVNVICVGRTGLEVGGSQLRDKDDGFGGFVNWAELRFSSSNINQITKQLFM